MHRRTHDQWNAFDWFYFLCFTHCFFISNTQKTSREKKHNFPLYLRSAGRATTTAKMTRAMSVRYMILPLDPLALLYASPHFAAIPMTYDLPHRKPNSNRCHSHMSIFLRFGLGYMGPQGIRPGKFISVHRRTLYWCVNCSLSRLMKLKQIFSEI